MAKKMKTEFLCSECGETFHKWLGKCTSCGAFNTVTEFKVPVSKRKTGISAGLNSIGKIRSLTDCSVTEVERISTGFPEIDVVLGGGIVKGSMILLGGSPGIGKSTITLQITSNISKIGKKVLYVSGEESIEQIALRAKRLSADKEPILILTETSAEAILVAVQNDKPDFLVIDSIQTLYAEDISGAPGSVSQVRECTAMMMTLAKQEGISLLIIGHVTKDGAIAGPRVLEHMVDTVLNFEGDSNQTYRILRGIKNRFGPSGEIALLGMESNGLVEMKDVARFFIHQSSLDRPGSAVVPVLEGSRVLMVEVQALVSPSHFGLPQRVASGINQKKLALIVAIIERYAGITLGDHDIFLNITGGLNISISETAVDLAIAAALLSSFRNRVIPPKTAFLGELGLSGEIRPVIDSEKRIKELATMGFERVITSSLTSIKEKTPIKIYKYREIAQFEQILV